LITIFGNGAVFGAVSGAGARIAARWAKFAKTERGIKTVAAITSRTEKIVQGTKNIAKGASKFLVVKPIIFVGNIAVTGLKALGKLPVNWWKAFKETKSFRKISQYIRIVGSDAKDYQRAMKSVSLPGKVQLVVGRGVSNTFKAIGRFEDRMFNRGYRLTAGKALSDVRKASQVAGVGNAIEKTRAAEINRLQSEGKNVEATNLSLYKSPVLDVAKDAAEARTPAEWNDIKKIVSDNVTGGMDVKKLEGVESLVVADHTAGDAGKSLLINTEKDIKEIAVNPAEVQSVHTYNEGKTAIVKHSDGSYTFHDLEAKMGEKPFGRVGKNKSQLVDALMGKETAEYESLVGKSFNDVKTNLKLNKTAFKETHNPDGTRTLEIESPKGCSPGVVKFSSSGIAL